MSIRPLHPIDSEVEANNSSNTSGTQSDPATKVTIFDGATQVDVRHATFTTVGRDITYVNYASEVTEILSALKPVDRSGYYVQPCMNGTREKFFGEIDTWLDDIDAPNVLWIVGSPGSGKSTIASSLVSQLTKRGRMGSNFAFKRGNITLSDPAAVWRTIAHDLARYDDSFASILAAVLKSGTVDPGRPDIASHFESLIMEPLTKRHNQSSPHDIPVIVLDGSDECGSDPSQTGQRNALLDTFVHWSHLPRKFKLIVTGRDERVHLSFRSCCKQIELPTGAEVDMDTTQDIRNFLERRFAEIGGPYLDSWPGEKVLDTLTARAAGLFIWAETVIRFVEQGLPDEQLEHVLMGNLGEGDNVTELYRQILELSFRDAKVHMLNVLHQVATVIVLAKITLHVDDLPSFILHPKASVIVILNKLSSVISVGSDSGIRIRHLSFAEFMCDPHRCPQRFYIDRFKGSHDMSMACLRLMKKCLKFNICDLETSYLPNKHVEDLSRRITRNIGHPLIYSCRFWAAHIRDTPTDLKENVDLTADVGDIFQSYFLYWLEVMSLMEEVMAANIALPGVAGWIRVFDAKLSDIIRDGSRFIVNFFTPISESTPHIYLSALPFSPRDSIIAMHYRSQFPNTLSVHSGLDRTWRAGINVLHGHKDAILSISFSPDGKRIVSGSRDKSIRVWDAETGEMVSGPFEGHTDQVWSVAFSPDGKRIVSGSKDKSIRTGEMVSGPFEGHTDQVWSIAFSPNGKQIVSGSDDKSICVWDAGTGEMVSGPFKGHTYGVLSVAFSPDGKQIVSGSWDKSICVWDAETGKIVSGPFEGHTDPVLSITFSPDGKQIVSGSDDKSICVWDANTDQITVLGTGNHSMELINFTCSIHCISSGWVCCPHSILIPLVPPTFLFWVPYSNRTGLCGIDTLLVLGTCPTRVDLSRFVHGTSWTLCYSSHASSL
ncbi:hypothetical protein PILCRDRAFT_801778 [Piloderma croceum F 1598]|uniref:NACHT domain-containing protein n=1 Tax=Piloderma croceum (strain F 1598) TaxID=765440 RepID=A0A0C3F1N1_PILCF|nr:hypothetical protein PILCRDRAFT_801778 [Piloderma croceum F 1598]